jgi:hypothetical protein
VHGRLDNLFVFDDQLAADCVVMERLRRLRTRDVEAGEIAAGRAAVSGRHGTTVLGEREPADSGVWA